jgi:hypothetical protein
VGVDDLLVSAADLAERPDDEPEVPKARRVPARELPLKVFHSAKAPLARILVITIPTIILVALLIEMGVFDRLAGILAGTTPALSGAGGRSRHNRRAVC